MVHKTGGTIMANTINMTEGKPFPIIFKYFIPILCSSLLQQLYSIVDTIVVGKGINDLIIYLCHILFLAILI
jgi:Na+-driven multidrug efflux pump